MIGTALGHRRRRRAARARPRGARRRRSAPSRSSARSSAITVVLSTCSPRALPESRAPERQSLREVLATICSAGRSSMAAAFVAVPSVMFGAIEVLVPLRIDDLGGGHALIAGGFIVGAAHRGGAGAARRPLLRPGRPAHAVRRRARRSAAVGDGRRSRVGAGARRRRRAALIVTSLGAGLCFAPALTMLSDVAESSTPAPGLRRRALEHGLGLGPGDRRRRRRRRRQPRRQRGAEHRVAASCCAHRASTRSAALPRAAAPQPPRAEGWSSDGYGGADGGEWRNWAGDQPAARRELVRPREPRRAGRGGRRGRGRGPEGQRRRLGPLVHRGGDDRRDDDRRRGARAA